MDRRQQLEFLRRELKITGSATTIDGGGECGSRVLACLLPSDDGELTEGHFYIEPLSDGSWKVHGRPYPATPVHVSDTVSLGALASLGVELLLEARYDYVSSIDRETPPLPMPPPSLRARKPSDLAEELIAGFVDGQRAGAGNHGFDILSQDGRHRIQVKSSIRNKKSKKVSTLQFKSDPAWEGHDELFYVEFSEFLYPVNVWAIESDRLRDAISKGTGINDGKTHQVEPFLRSDAHDVTAPVREYFDRHFLLRTEGVQSGGLQVEAGATETHSSESVWLMCPNGHEDGPWFYVESPSRQWRAYRIGTGFTYISLPTAASPDPEFAPGIMRCEFVENGDPCMAEMPIPDHMELIWD